MKFGKKIIYMPAHEAIFSHPLVFEIGLYSKRKNLKSSSFILAFGI